MKRFAYLAAVILAVIIVWTIAWYWAAGEVTKYVATLAEPDGPDVPSLSCDSFGVGGYPFGFDLTCTGATLVSGDTTLLLTGIKATALVYRPTHILLSAQSPLTLADAFTGSQSRIDFAGLEASVRLEGWRIGRASLVADSVLWNDTLGSDRLVASVAHAEVHLVDIPEKHDGATHRAALAAYGTLEGAVVPGIEVKAGASALEAELDGLPDDVRVLAEADPLSRWQQAGGRLAIVDFRGEDGDSVFEASGTLGLDSQGRVEGQVKLASKGIVERLGTLVPDNLRTLALGSKAADGSYAQTVNIRAGVVFSGLVPAMVIPPLY